MYTCDMIYDTNWRSVRSHGFHDLAVEVRRSNLVCHKRFFVPSSAHMMQCTTRIYPSFGKAGSFQIGQKLNWHHLINATLDGYYPDLLWQRKQNGTKLNKNKNAIRG